MSEPPAPKSPDELPTRRHFVVRASSATAALQLGLRWKAMATPANMQSTLDTVAATNSTETNVVLNVNGVDRSLRVEPRVTLLDALRDRFGLTGTKKGCDQGTCGACTVLINGRRIDSCLTLAVMHEIELRRSRGLPGAASSIPSKLPWSSTTGFSAVSARLVRSSRRLRCSMKDTRSSARPSAKK